MTASRCSSPDCTRQPAPNFRICGACLDKILAGHFREPASPLARLSASDPYMAAGVRR